MEGGCIRLRVRRERADALTTLGIAALMHGTDQAVRDCARRLLGFYSQSVDKSLLTPMTVTKDAMSLILEEICNVP